MAAVAPASRRSVRLVVVAAVTLAVLAVASLISLPYAVVSPGPAVNVLMGAAIGALKPQIGRAHV